MCGNGAAIGTAVPIIVPVRRIIPLVLRRARTASLAVAVGTTMLRTAEWPVAAAIRPRTATTST